jgi:hypothetical protein
MNRIGHSDNLNRFARFKRAGKTLARMFRRFGRIIDTLIATSCAVLSKPRSTINGVNRNQTGHEKQNILLTFSIRSADNSRHKDTLDIAYDNVKHIFPILSEFFKNNWPARKRRHAVIGFNPPRFAHDRESTR